MQLVWGNDKEDGLCCKKDLIEMPIKLSVGVF